MYKRATVIVWCGLLVVPIGCGILNNPSILPIEGRLYLRYDEHHSGAEQNSDPTPAFFLETDKTYPCGMGRIVIFTWRNPGSTVIRVGVFGVKRFVFGCDATDWPVYSPSLFEFQLGSYDLRIENEECVDRYLLQVETDRICIDPIDTSFTSVRDTLILREPGDRDRHVGDMR